MEARTDEAEALLTAISGLHAFHGEHAVRVLRRALIELLQAETQPPSPVMLGNGTQEDADPRAAADPTRSRPRPRPVKPPPADWPSLREQLRAVPVSERDQLVRAAHVSRDSMRTWLAPGGRAPGTEVIKRLRRALAKRGPQAGASEAAAGAPEVAASVAPFRPNGAGLSTAGGSPGNIA